MLFFIFVKTEANKSLRQNKGASKLNIQSCYSFQVRLDMVHAVFLEEKLILKCYLNI